jgi:hypothetical protein
MFRILGIVLSNRATASERGSISEDKKQKSPKAVREDSTCQSPSVGGRRRIREAKTIRNADDLH